MLRCRRPQTPLVLAAAVALAGCELYIDSGSGDDPGPGVGSSVRLSISVANDECGVDSATATVSAGDIATIGSVALTVGASSITGTVEDVPAGFNRNVVVSAFDGDGLVVYEGSTMVDVVGGQTVSATVTLFRDFDNCPDTGDIDIDGGLDNGTGEPPPAGVLPFGYTRATLADDGVVYLMDVSSSSIQRYDVAAESLLAPLAGTGTAVTIAVAPDGDEVYLSYTGGRMDVFDTAASAGTFFAAAPATVSSMEVTGDFVFTIDGSGAWDTHALHARADGARVASDDWRNTSRSMAWAPGMGRLFFLNSGVSPTDISMVDIDASAGTLGNEADSPYHGDYSLPNPVRLLPDESLIVVGSGNFFSTADLSYSTSFGLSFTDIAFHGTSYYLLQPDGAHSQLTVLDMGFSIVSTHGVTGAPRDVFTHGDALVVITQTGMDEHAIRAVQIADL